MTDKMEAGDQRRLAPIDDTLPVPPEHDDEPVPEEVSDAVFDQ
jgi:hypothetical protein